MFCSSLWGGLNFDNGIFTMAGGKYCKARLEQYHVSSYSIRSSRNMAVFEVA